MEINQVIKDALEEYPEVRVVLEVARLAHEAESKELPKELGTSGEVAAMPTASQCGVYNQGVS